MSRAPAVMVWMMLFATLAAGCTTASGGRSEPPASTTSGAGVGETCRAPDEPGCNPCCEQGEGGGCTVKRWAPGPTSSAEENAVEPWYNENSFEERCPDQCRACARCSKRDEQELKQLGTRPECDCTQPPGVDACFTPGSCGCYCDRLNRLGRACPELMPRR
ncbi:hypothetical protein [Archangium lipolyticum]|uniref:hypothetical protein n=1 Tax=Archangium lipolyticum TaxID=2970465 RepID=UPI002149DC1F|nr:hypothetical protein [Archangium lipolyticum]